MTTIDVVSAVMMRGDPCRVFLTQRRAGGSFPFAWEAPGGHVEPGETRKQALRRELREEIGLDEDDYMFTAPTGRDGGDDGSTLWRETFCINGRLYCCSMHLVVPSDDVVLRPREQQIGSGWFTHEEIRGLNHTPAVARSLDVVRAEMLARSAPARLCRNLQHAVSRNHFESDCGALPAPEKTR